MCKKGNIRFSTKKVNYRRKSRDGYGVDPENIFLTDGASSGVITMIKIMLNGKQDGIMIPIPQYPLYSATIDICQGKQVHYFTDEEKGWGLNVKHLGQVLKKAKNDNITVKGITVINPGNPTGTVKIKNYARHWN